MEVRRVGTFLDYFERVHERTRRVVTCVREEDLEWLPAPGRMTAGDLIRHLATTERYMYAETVHGRPSAYAGHGRELADGLPATIAFYDRLHAESRALFTELTDARLTETCLTPGGNPISVGKWLRAMVEHEAHHRGQLYFVLGLRGVATPPIFGLTAEQVYERSIASA
jgi:uncharacterized damage-inducible protein DinB